MVRVGLWACWKRRGRSLEQAFYATFEATNFFLLLTATFMDGRGMFLVALSFRTLPQSI